MVESQGKVSEKSGNFEMDIEWQPCNDVCFGHALDNAKNMDPDHTAPERAFLFRAPDKSVYWKTIFFIIIQNICCGYSITIVGILTFISMKNTTSERLPARNFFICRYFSFYEQL